MDYIHQCSKLELENAVLTISVKVKFKTKALDEIWKFPYVGIFELYVTYRAWPNNDSANNSMIVHDRTPELLFFFFIECSTGRLLSKYFTKKKKRKKRNGLWSGLSRLSADYKVFLSNKWALITHTHLSIGKTGYPWLWRRLGFFILSRLGFLTCSFVWLLTPFSINHQILLIGLIISVSHFSLMVPLLRSATS